MRSRELRIGMKVVPTKKSVGAPGHQTWRDVSEVAKAIRMGQPYLYVTGWDKDEKCWKLSASENSIYYSFFLSSDFYPYTGENNEI